MDEVPVRGLEQKSERDKTLRMIQRALTEGWELPERLKTTLPKALFELWSDPEATIGHKTRIAEVLVAMDAKNADKLLALAKEVRLDDGQVTERYEFRPMEF